MNQIFSFPRFIRYARFQAMNRRRLNLLAIAGISVAILFLLTFMLTHARHWNLNDWKGAFIMPSLFITLFVTGYSFPYFRKKEASLHALMLPVSTFEKFIYEVISRIIVFISLYLILYYVFANIAVFFAEFIQPERTIIPFRYRNLYDDIRDKKAIYLVSSAYLLVVTLVFAGASAIRKHPLIKTMVFVGAVLLTGFGYFYLLIEKMGLGNGIKYVAEKFISSGEEAAAWLCIFLMGSAICALVYAFFNLKEKEV